MVYLDNSSTTREADEVNELIARISIDDFGNPSSLHSLGLSAEKRIDTARSQVAAILGSDPGTITFNSGGTEGDNTVLFGVSEKRRHDGNRIVISEVEHPAIMEAAKALEQRGVEVVKVGIHKASDDFRGMIDMEELKDAVNDDTVLVSIMTVNNETGAVMPINEIAKIAHMHGAMMHTDAVQAYGKIDLADIVSGGGAPESAADFLTASSHKIHGPKGVGMLYTADPASRSISGEDGKSHAKYNGIRRTLTSFPPYILGGGQEKGRRSGTENVSGIAGFGLASELAVKAGKDAFDHVQNLRDLLRKGIEDEIPDVLVNSPDDALPYVLNVSFIGTRGEVILHTLEQDGIYVSTGSACSSNRNEKSHVLAAMGRSDKEIEAAIRFSFSRYNTEEEVAFTLEKLKSAVENFRRLGSYR